jgi:hypothetical protein
MRKLFAIAVLAAIVTAGSALAADTAQQGVMKSCSAKWTAMTAADKAKTKHTDFMSSCMKAPSTTAATTPAAAPAMAMKPAAAGSMAMTAKPAAGSMAKAATGGGQAKCKDGTTVTYKTRSGTCSGHKGVATWL